MSRTSGRISRSANSIDAVAEEPFVVGQRRSERHGSSGLRAHDRNAIIAKQDSWHAAMAARTPRTMAPVSPAWRSASPRWRTVGTHLALRSRASRPRSRASSARRRGPAAGRSGAAAGAARRAGQPGPGRASRSSAAASTSSASTSSSPTARAAGHRPHAGRLRGPRGQQAADDRAVPPDQGRRQPEARRSAAARRSATATTRRPRRHATTCGVFVIFLDDYHVRLGELAVGQGAADAVHPDAAPAQRHGRRSCIR